MAASSQADSTFLQLLEDNYLECSLCMHTYKKPKFLNCFHTFCEGCLTEYVKHKPGDIVCPTCRDVTQVSPNYGIPGLKNNFLITSLIEESSLFKSKQVKCENCSKGKMAAMVCVECAAYLCDACYNAHQTVKALRDTHNTIDVKALENVGKLQVFQRNRFKVCPLHNEPKKLYCQTERKQLCHTCSFSTTHKSHDVCPIQEQLDQLLTEITTNLGNHMIDDSLITSENKKLEVLISVAETTTIQSLAEIDVDEAVIIQYLKAKYNTMRKEIQDVNQESIYISQTKIAKNQELLNCFRGKTSKRDALRVIPISSGIEAAGGLLLSINNMGRSSDIQKMDEMEMEQLKYCSTYRNFNEKPLVNIGCVKRRIIRKLAGQVEKILI